MNENKNQIVFLTVIGIATLLVAIVGATFAWFGISVNESDVSENVVRTITSLGTVTFTDSNKIDIPSINMGDIKTKTFTVAQTDTSSTTKIKYNIILNVTNNTLTSVSNKQFVHYLTSTGNTNNGVLATLEESEVPTTSVIIGSGELNGYETHTYTYNISLKKAEVDSKIFQDKVFNGYITVELEQ